MSLIDLASNWVRNSWQLGMAVRVVKSNRLLQSVMAMSWWLALYVGMEMAGGRSVIFSGFCQWIFESSNQAQYSLIQVNWSRDVDSADVSADNVLVTMRWIFFVPHDNGLITQDLFWVISLWVARIIIPAWDSGLLFDAKDASEKATNLTSLRGIGWILIFTSLCFLALWRTLLAVTSVDTVAELIWDCKRLSELERSGLVWTAAYWSDPTNPLRLCRSSSVTVDSSWVFLIGVMEIGWMLFTYLACESWMLLSGNCCMSIPVNVNDLDFLDPKGYFFSSFWICWWKNSSPPWIPSSTWTPRAPESFPVSGCRSTYRHGSKGLETNPRLFSSSHNVWNQRKGASMSP